MLDTARAVDEKVFELPVTETEGQLIKKSDVADLVNHTNGHGKALFAAAFITLTLVVRRHIFILILQDLLRLTELHSKDLKDLQAI